MPENENLGVPIYLDSVERSLIDTVTETHQPNEWHPMNGPATRLLKCREALQDIQEVLESYHAVQSPTKRRRRLRSIFVPLHSLCVALIDLINQIQSDKQIHDRLPANSTQILTQLRTRFVTLVPFSRDGQLGILRNRVSAHYEKTLSPQEMRELYQQATPTKIGEWLHLSLSVMCDLMKLDAYSWTADGPEPNTTIIMCQEPIMTVLRVEDGQVVGLGGFYARSVSPLVMVFQHVEDVASASQILFEEHSQYQITGFHPDSKNDWARTLTTTVA